MDEQGYRFGVGVLVVASLVIAVILVLFFGAAPNFLTKRYVVTIRFDAAPGVATDTPVRKNGVQIGRVKSVQLLDEEGVDLALELDAAYKIRAGEMPQIGTGSIITGDAVVEFIPATPKNLLARFDGTGGSPKDGMLDANEKQLADAQIQDGDFLSGGRVAPDPLDTLVNMQDSFATTLTAIEQAGNQVNGLALDVRKIIGGGDGELQKIAQKAEMTIDNFNQTLDAIEIIFRDPNLKSALDTVATRLPELVDEAEAVMQQTESTLASFEGVGQAAEETMQNITEFTEPLGDQGEQIVLQALRTLDNLDGLLVDVRQITARVNNSDGTLARLLDDETLYYSLVDTVQNVETLTRRLRPVVEDARVLSDKLARDPSRLIDLRGAITGRPRGGIK